MTTILAFLPILLLQTGAGIFLRSMPATVILTLLASLLIALMLSPLLASVVLKGHDNKPPLLLRGLHRVTSGPYKTMLSSSLRYPWLILLTAIAILFGSIMLAGQLGVSMFPKAEKDMLLVNI